jgi:phospholipid/cholesterol/gamma-HCH transport system substrate-binding protein
MMERKANYALIGLFTFAVIAGAFGFIFWLHHSSGKKQAVAYRVIFDSSVSGLQVGGSVLFNGIRVGEVTNLRLDPDKPSQVVAMLAINKSTPIRSDTRVGLEFAGLTGVASVSLKGVSATTPLIEKEEGEPPTLKADPTASQDMMQAARNVLNKAEEVIAANQEALHQAIKDIAAFTATLARNSDNVDEIMKNTKEVTASVRSSVDEIMTNSKDATASIRTLADNLDKRTDDITIGINKMTATATRQIEIAGKALTDLAHNPQRILFGGSSSSSSSSPPTTAPAPAPVRRQTTAPTPAPARRQAQP